MFGKKKKEEEDSEEPEENTEETPLDSGSTPATLGQAIADLEKLKAKFNTFYEINKASTERFTRVNEQIGELRTMLLERDKDGRMLEAKATQAIDLVESVHPDKLMVEVRKQDAKIEALKGNIESNEMVMKNSINELKQMRSKMQMFTGIEQVVKLNDEVKTELMEIKKVAATITRHADKVETIFSEMQKRFSDFEKFIDNLNDLDKSSKDTISELDSLKAKAGGFADKKEVENIIIKFNNFEKHVSGIVTLVSRKFENFEKETKENLDEKLAKVEKLLTGFQTLAEKTPDLDKYFKLLDEVAKKVPKEEKKPEKIKTPGEEEKVEVPEKLSIIDKFKEKMPKIGSRKK